MLGLPPKTFMAIEAVFDIAYYAGGMPVQSGEITGRQGIPRRSLEPLLQRMARAGILIGLRGPRGGYRLARERRHITAGEIVRLVIAEDEPNQPSDDAGLSELGAKVVRPLWDALGREIMTKLDALSLEDLCQSAREAGIAGFKDQASDYTI